MKAVVLTKFGPPDVLEVQEVPKPTPKEHEVLIRIHATTASAGDCELRGLKFPIALRWFLRIYMGLVRPKPIILGQELAGEVQAIGGAVTRFRPGDPVVAWAAFRLGGYAEYACLPESGAIAAKPSNVTYAEAAPMAVGGLEAAHFIRRANLRGGEEALIVGAGGSIGTFAVQLAKTFGARVTAVDRPEKLEMLRSIGADQVIDYTQQDYTSRGESYDVLFDVAGKVSPSLGVRLVRTHGRYLMGNPGLSLKMRARWAARGRDVEVIPWAQKTPGETAESFRLLRELIEAEKVTTVIDRRYPLEQAAEAHRYVDTGRKKGNVVIEVESASPTV